MDLHRFQSLNLPHDPHPPHPNQPAPAYGWSSDMPTPTHPHPHIMSICTERKEGHLFADVEREAVSIIEMAGAAATTAHLISFAMGWCLLNNVSSGDWDSGDWLDGYYYHCNNIRLPSKHGIAAGCDTVCLCCVWILWRWQGLKTLMTLSQLH